MPLIVTVVTECREEEKEYLNEVFLLFLFLAEIDGVEQQVLLFLPQSYIYQNHCSSE